MLKQYPAALAAVAAVLILLLSGCATSSDSTSSQPADAEARAEYQAAFDKWKALTHLEVDNQVQVKMALGSEQETIHQTTHIKAIRTGENQIEATVQTVNEGEQVNSYYKDGYLYAQKKDSRKKMAASPEMVLQAVDLFKPEHLTDIQIEQKDGVKTLKATLSDQALAKSIETALGQSAEMVNGMQVKSEKAVFTLNEQGYITSSSVNFTFLVQGEIGTLTIQIESVTNYQNIGATFTITPPPDLDTYTETEST